MARSDCTAENLNRSRAVAQYFNQVTMRAVIQFVAIAALLAVLVNAAQAKGLGNALAETMKKSNIQAKLNELVKASKSAHLREMLSEKKGEMADGLSKAVEKMAALAETAGENKRERRTKSSSDSDFDDVVDAAVEFIGDMAEIIEDAIDTCEEEQEGGDFDADVFACCLGNLFFVEGVAELDSFADIIEDFV